MIIPPGPLKVLVATQPVDFRKGMAGLASLVQQELRLDPFSGMLFVFRARRVPIPMKPPLVSEMIAPLRSEMMSPPPETGPCWLRLLLFRSCRSSSL